LLEKTFVTVVTLLASSRVLVDADLASKRMPDCPGATAIRSGTAAGGRAGGAAPESG